MVIRNNNSIFLSIFSSGYNFDAIVCESCKAFFRRNALQPLVIIRKFLFINL
jgi:hypothetical protein